MDGSLSSKVKEIIDNFCGRKVSWDEDLIESSNLDTNEELLGSLYAECVSIAQVEEKTDVDDYELNDKRLPTPQEKEKHSKVLNPLPIFDISMEEDQPSEHSRVDSTTYSTCLKDLKISNSEEECKNDSNSIVSDLNSNQVVNPSQLSSQSSSDCVKVMKSSSESNTDPAQRGVDLNATHTIDAAVVNSARSKTHLNFDSKKLKVVDLNITQTLNSPKTSGECGASNNNKRETSMLTKPIVAVIPMTQNVKTEKISPRVILKKNTRGKAVSRTPPAMGSVESRHKLNPSKSTSRLLTSFDVRFGSSNGLSFKRPLPSLPSSAPSYMAPTTASFSRLKGQKENQKPSNDPQTSNTQKMSLLRTGTVPLLPQGLSFSDNWPDHDEDLKGAQEKSTRIDALLSLLSLATGSLLDGGLSGELSPRTGKKWPPYPEAHMGYWARQAGFYGGHLNDQGSALQYHNSSNP
ncbi:unnamed protein product [Lepeophtheirus salmonis]|uniref:(salmon louse) hypothetical protein n=1 Tax=Lepeophtheirus salmonis TaxID=72036 RepID=A0A7R8CY97_LEPSM|nr:unnamed protein product [Lepeophtheirus salmonis]CAF2939519.1 unnamed protein product [Lepeophtheirus salmonis]